MSKTWHMHDYVSVTDDVTKIVRKYYSTLDNSYSFKEFAPSEKAFGINKPFHGQRVDGYVRAGKYVVRGLFLDPNNYAV